MTLNCNLCCNMKGFCFGVVCIEVSIPPQKHHPLFFCQAPFKSVKSPTLFLDNSPYIRANSSCFMHAIVVCMGQSFFKIFSNFVYIFPNFQVFCPFFTLFWKIACMPFLSRIGSVCIGFSWTLPTKNQIFQWTPIRASIIKSLLIVIL